MICISNRRVSDLQHCTRLSQSPCPRADPWTPLRRSETALPRHRDSSASDRGSISVPRQRAGERTTGASIVPPSCRVPAAAPLERCIGINPHPHTLPRTLADSCALSLASYTTLTEPPTADPDDRNATSPFSRRTERSPQLPPTRNRADPIDLSTLATLVAWIEFHLSPVPLGSPPEHECRNAACTLDLSRTIHPHDRKAGAATIVRNPRPGAYERTAYPQDVQQQAATSSVGSSPRAGSFSGSSVVPQSYDSNTSYASSVDGTKIVGLQTPSPEQITYPHNGIPAPPPHHYAYPPQAHHPQGYSSMNQPQPYMDVSQSHAPPPGSAPSMPHFTGYGQSQALQPAPHNYAPTPYGAYSYGPPMAPISAGHPVTTSMGGQMIPQSTLPLPAMGPNGPPPGAPQSQGFSPAFDTSGQIAPHGMKPRVTATLWEDEGSLCFQVEANGVCVARREDNHMINGTKLLNVAGMTRGRRDGILKSEKTRHVVKIGPMHLKGVWIPFDRALDFANKEKITEALYPLFVHNIGALLYHPTNQSRQSIGTAAMAARRPEQQQPEYMRTPQSSQPPAHGHHHPMTTPSGGNIAQPPHSIAPHPSSGGSYEYAGPHHGAINSGQPLPVDASGMTARSVPTTPVSSSPGNPIQYQTSQGYDGSRQMYSAPSSYGHYPPQQASMPRYGLIQPGAGGHAKNDMGPPLRAGTDGEHPEAKAPDGYGSQQDVEGEHEGEYTHSSASYDARPPAHSYPPNAPTGSGHADQSHISPKMTHSPHQNGSGRATPRTTNTYTGYSTPQRASQLPSSNLNYVMSTDTRAGAPQQNGTTEPYTAGGYPPQQYPSMNGSAPTSNKRTRDDEAEDSYAHNGTDQGVKRQRTDPGAVRPISQPVKAGGARR
nr:cell pattern formation-associated protein stua [Quercus suber]